MKITTTIAISNPKYEIVSIIVITKADVPIFSSDFRVFEERIILTIDIMVKEKNQAGCPPIRTSVSKFGGTEAPFTRSIKFNILKLRARNAKIPKTKQTILIIK